MVNTDKAIGWDRNEMAQKVALDIPDGSYVMRSAEKLREWIAGFDTRRERADDIIHITGGCSSENSEGNIHSLCV